MRFRKGEGMGSLMYGTATVMKTCLLLASLVHFIRYSGRSHGAFSSLITHVLLGQRCSCCSCSVHCSCQPFQRQRWGNLREMGWSVYGLFRAHRYHLELNSTVHAVV